MSTYDPIDVCLFSFESHLMFIRPLRYQLIVNFDWVEHPPLGIRRPYHCQSGCFFVEIVFVIFEPKFAREFYSSKKLNLKAGNPL